MKKHFQNFLTRNRGLVIFVFAVPISFVYQRIQNLKNWYYRNFIATNKLHDEEVEKIQELVKRSFVAGKKMCTARPTWQTMSIRKATYKDDCARIPINLKNILEIDEHQMILKVEPMATMGDITHYLLPKGMALKVQVEMDDLTVGGLCMGLGIETTSHRYGFLFETIKAYEIITAQGELIRATEESHPELFHALPMSRGTLGFLVAVELEIVRVQEYMKLRYVPCYTREEFCTTFQALATSETPADYLEGLAFSAETGVIMIGEMTGRPSDGASINPINRWYKRWFYTHVEEMLKSGETVEYIPLRHYFHRHTPSIFFQLKNLIPFANRAWYRWFFAWMGAPKVSLMKYTMTRELRKLSLQKQVAQDIIIPMDEIGNGLSFMSDHYNLYPLWVCPVKIKNKGMHSGFLPKVVDAEERMFVDIGVYGIPPAAVSGNWDGVNTSRKLEKFARDVDGFQMLYADIFMTQSEFEEMFDHQLYMQVRKKYLADKAFPGVYEKVIPESWLIDLGEEVAEKKPKGESVV